jgi:hypothetical protein
MSDYDGTILFKDWLPDQPELNNPGLIDAANVEPYGESYQSVKRLTTAGFAALAARPLGFLLTDWEATSILYAGTGTRLYASTEGSAFTALSATTASIGYWDFDRFDDYIIATDYQTLPMIHTLGSASNFSTLGSTMGTAPKAQVVGVINKFVMLGYTNETVNGAVPYRLQWSAIDSPRDWPLPNSATAVATQAGEQYLDPASGTVTAISSGDQFGLVFQIRAITRVSYVGGGVVFQFDRISDHVGCPYPRSVLKVGSLVYFISSQGVFATDGVTLIPLGNGKVDNWLFSVLYNLPSRVIGAVNPVKGLIYWAFPVEAITSNPDWILIYNYQKNRFAYAVIPNTGIVSPFDRGNASSIDLIGFGNSFTQGSFSGAPDIAVLTTGDLEMNPGGLTHLSGIKPLVAGTTSSISAAVGSRASVSGAVSFTTEASANARTGFANFRSESRFHRMRLTIAGTFNAVHGVQYQAEASGYV